MTAVREGHQLRTAAKAVDTEQQAPPDLSKCSLTQLSARVVKILLGQDLLQMTLPRSNWTQNHLTSKPELTHMTSCLLGLYPPHSVVNVDANRQTWPNLLHVIASHWPAHLQHAGSGYNDHDWQVQARRAMESRSRTHTMPCSLSQQRIHSHGPANNQFTALNNTSKYAIMPAKGERVVITYVLLRNEHVVSYQRQE